MIVSYSALFSAYPALDESQTACSETLALGQTSFGGGTPLESAPNSSALRRKALFRRREGTSPARLACGQLPQGLFEYGLEKCRPHTLRLPAGGRSLSEILGR